MLLNIGAKVCKDNYKPFEFSQDLLSYFSSTYWRKTTLKPKHFHISVLFKCQCNVWKNLNEYVNVRTELCMSGQKR